MKNSQKGIIGFLAIAILVALGGLYFYTQSKPSSLETDNIKNENSQNNNSSTPVEETTAKAKVNCEEYYNIPYLSQCVVSPNGEWAVAQTREGLRVIGIDKKMIELSKSRFDVATLWFSDSEHVLGFSGTIPPYDCEGGPVECPRVPDERKLVIWDTKLKTHSNIGVTTPPLSYDLEWIVPDHSAYVYARDMSGSEGSNFYYTLNLDTKTISGPTKNPNLR